MNKTDRGILYGMLLGDGNLYLATNNFGVKYVKLTIGHSPKQREYLEHKCQLLHSIFGGKKPKVYTYKSFNQKSDKYYENLQTVKTNTYFRQMHRLLYPEGKKVYTKKVLDYLTDHGLALWFMDDGSGSVKYNSKGEPKGFYVSLSTYCPKEEAEIIQLWFLEKYGLEAKFSIDKRNNLYSIRFNSKDSMRFKEIVTPYIHHSMLYKIGCTQERQTSCKDIQEDDIVQQ